MKTPILKSAIYQTQEGPKTFYYDSQAPCIMCDKPVIEASMGGTAVCSWCDIGIHRDGTPWTYKETIMYGKKAAEHHHMQDLLMKIENKLSHLRKKGSIF